jgi:hypothetical protein
MAIDGHELTPGSERRRNADDSHVFRWYRPRCMAASLAVVSPTAEYRD